MNMFTCQIEYNQIISGLNCDASVGLWGYYDL